MLELGPDATQVRVSLGLTTIRVRRDPGTHESPRRLPASLRQVRHPVNVIRLPLHAPHMGRATFIRIGDTIDQHVHLAPDKSRQLLGGNRTLYLDDFF